MRDASSLDRGSSREYFSRSLPHITLDWLAPARYLKPGMSSRYLGYLPHSQTQDCISGTPRVPRRTNLYSSAFRPTKFSCGRREGLSGPVTTSEPNTLAIMMIFFSYYFFIFIFLLFYFSLFFFPGYSSENLPKNTSSLMCWKMCGKFTPLILLLLLRWPLQVLSGKPKRRQSRRGFFLLSSAFPPIFFSYGRGVFARSHDRRRDLTVRSSAQQ